MKLLIAGSRKFERDLDELFDAGLVGLAIYSLGGVTVIAGGARGVDTAAEEWAESTGIDFQEYPADWDGLGRRAGYIRNCEMVEACDAAIIVWDGKSKGTKHTIDLLVKAHKSYVLMVYPEAL